MFFVGERIAVKARRLVEVTYEAMMRGIAVVRPGVHIGAIGDAIQRYAESHRFSVVRDFCGHGVGRIFHDAPSILHYGHPDDGPAMREGMIFTVEPMINAGRWEVKILSDGWTAVTKDRSLSAQFEHTVGRDRNRLRDLHDLAGRAAPATLCPHGFGRNSRARTCSALKGQASGNAASGNAASASPVSSAASSRASA